MLYSVKITIANVAFYARSTKSLEDALEKARKQVDTTIKHYNVP